FALATCSLSSVSIPVLAFLFITAPAPPDIYTLSLHDALPISPGQGPAGALRRLRLGLPAGTAVPPGVRRRGRAVGGGPHLRQPRGAHRRSARTSHPDSRRRRGVGTTRSSSPAGRRRHPVHRGSRLGRPRWWRQSLRTPVSAS